MASPVPIGTLVVPTGLPGIGEPGVPAFTPTTDDFTVPEIGDTVTVEVERGDWLVPDAYVVVGGMMGRVVSIAGNAVTLERVIPPAGLSGPPGPQGEKGEQGTAGSLGMGVTDGSNAAAGQVGEYLTSDSLIVNGRPYDSGNFNAGTLTLPAGDWDVWALLSTTVHATVGANVSQILYRGWLTVDPDLNNIPMSAGYTQFSWEHPGVPPNNATTSTIGPNRFSLSASATINLIATIRAAYTPTNASSRAQIYARRAR